TQGNVTGGVYAVAWNGASWQLNNSSVVGAAASAPRTENLTTAAGSDVVTLAPTNTAKTANTANGSFTVSATASTVTADNVSSPVTGAGIPASTVVTDVSSDGSSATLSKAATATATGVTLTLSSVFHSSDSGATLSGNGNIPGGATIMLVSDSTHAKISAAATGAGAGVATPITPTGQVRNTTVTSSSTFNPTLTGGFVAADVGKVTDSACTFGNTKITNVSGGNATIAPGAKSTCSSFSAKIGFTAMSAS